MTKLLFRSLGLVPIALVMAGINYVVDPGVLFRDDPIAGKLAGILVSGRNFVQVQPFDDISMRRQYAQLVRERKQVLVLGSSRCMPIGQENFPSCSFHNGWISGGTLQSTRAILDEYRRQDHLPDLLILGCDPWILNSATSRDQDVDPSLFERLTRFAQLLSSELSAAIAPRGEFAASPFPPTRPRGRSTTGGRYIGPTAPDPSRGSGWSSGPKMWSSSFARDCAASAATSNFRNSTRSWSGASRTMVEEALAKNVRVVFWLATFHPYWHETYFSKPAFSQVPASETRFRAHRQHGTAFPIIGSFDPNACDVKEADFLDQDTFAPATRFAEFSRRLRSEPMSPRSL